MSERSAVNATPEKSNLVLEAIDQVDGQFVLRTSFVTPDERGPEVRADDRLSIELTAGEGALQLDPYTGRFVLTPKGDEPVRGHAVYEDAAGVRRVSADSALAFNVDSVPLEERTFEAAGGGACAAQWVLAMEAAFEVDVRASVMSNVVPLSPERRELYWRHGLYWAHHPAIGLMRIQYNPRYTSKIVLKRSGSNGLFFPSQVENRLFFIIDFSDLGYRGFNKEPMLQKVSDVSWPPFSDEVLAIEKPLEFYDVDDPGRLLMTLKSQDMRLYDYSSLDIEQLDASLDPDGSLTSRWRITNQSDERVRLRWFALGTFRRGDANATEGTRLLGAAGSGFERFDVLVQVDAVKSTLRQAFSLNAVSITDSIFAGRGQINYRFTDEERELL